MDIERCLKKSDCEIKILLLDTSNENQQYVIRAEEMCPQGHSYWFQIYEQSLKLLQELITKTKCSENRIKVRFYRDEYRYHYRLAKYHNANDSITTKLFMNVQPFNKDAVDVSIGFKGEHNDGIEGENFITLLDDGFDYLWDKYEHTEHRFDFSHAKEPEAEEVIND